MAGVAILVKCLNKLNLYIMKNLKLVLGVAFMLGSMFTAFGQSGDTVNSNYKNGLNQNPTMNDNHNLNQDQDINKSSQSPSYGNSTMDRTSPGQNTGSDYKLNKEDSVTLYKKSGTMINTDSDRKSVV